MRVQAWHSRNLVTVLGDGRVVWLLLEWGVYCYTDNQGVWQCPYTNQPTHEAATLRPLSSNTQTNHLTMFFSSHPYHTTILKPTDSSRAFVNVTLMDLSISLITSEKLCSFFILAHIPYLAPSWPACYSMQKKTKDNVVLLCIRNPWIALRHNTGRLESQHVNNRGSRAVVEGKQ